MNIQIKELENKITEIIMLSKHRLCSGECSEQNKFVIGSILQEFECLLSIFLKNGKLRLYCEKFPIATRWTIIDCADYDSQADNNLFDKVEKFNDLCKKIDEKSKFYERLE